jgi:hypothetical protein
MRETKIPTVVVTHLWAVYEREKRGCSFCEVPLNGITWEPMKYCQSISLVRKVPGKPFSTAIVNAVSDAWLCQGPSGRTGKFTSEMAGVTHSQIRAWGNREGTPLATKKHSFFDDGITLGQYVRI